MEDSVEGGKGTMQSKATFFKVLPVFQNPKWAWFVC